MHDKLCLITLIFFEKGQKPGVFDLKREGLVSNYSSKMWDLDLVEKQQHLDTPNCELGVTTIQEALVL